MSRRNTDGFGLGVLGSLLVMALLVDLGFTIEVRLHRPSQESSQVDVASGRDVEQVPQDVLTSSSSRRAPPSYPTRPTWHAKSTVQR